MAEIPFQRLGIPAEHRDKLGPQAPAKIKMAVAKGLLPLPPQVLVPMAYVLLGDPNPAVAEAARRTLLEIPAKTLIGGVLSPSTHPKILEFFAEFRRGEASLMEVIYRNREANDRTVMLIAESCDAELAEILMRNQERLLITPEVYLAFKRNPSARRADLDRVAAFLRMNKCLPDEGAQPAESPAASAPSADEAAALKQKLIEAEIEAALLGLPSPQTNPEVREKLEMFDLDALDEAAAGPDLGGFSFSFTEDSGFSFDLTDSSSDDRAIDEQERQNIVQQLAEMTIGQKIKLAYKGNAEVRKLLVRDRNKMVASAVIKSGRMNDSEYLMVASNRNLDGEVIRELTRIKEAMRKYPIKVALANNPKTPVSVAVGLVNQLQRRDLEAVARNKNVSGAVNQLANRKLKAMRPGAS